MLPMVHGYLSEDKAGRLDYIHSMNLRALEEVMQVEDDEDLWLAATNAKRAILIQYELERQAGLHGDGVQRAAIGAMVRTLAMSRSLSSQELEVSMATQGFDRTSTAAALESAHAERFVAKDARGRWSLTSKGRRFRWGKM